MLDRLREALFSTLVPWLPEASVLDLFAGSGSLGLEALSRGARRLHCVESDPAAARLIEDNARLLGEEERVAVVRGDALDPVNWGAEPFDIAFLDPPYPLLDWRGARAAIFQSIRELLAEHARPEAVVVYHAPRGRVSSAELGGLLTRSRDYGSGTLWYVQREDEPA